MMIIVDHALNHIIYFGDEYGEIERDNKQKIDPPRAFDSLYDKFVIS